MRSVRMLLVLACTTLVFSCKKSNYAQTPDQVDNRTEVYAAASILTLETILNELEYIGRGARFITSNEPGFFSCATLVRSTTDGNTLVELNFNSDAACADGIIRSGKLTINYNSNNENFYLRSESYKIGSMALKGDFQFSTIEEQGRSYLKLNVSNGDVSVANGDYIRFQLNRSSFFKEGSNTEAISDDVFETAAAEYQIELKDREVFTRILAEVDTPLQTRFSCSQKFRPRAGRIKFLPLNGNEKFLMFGNGNCSDSPVVQSK